MRECNNISLDIIYISTEKNILELIINKIHSLLLTSERNHKRIIKKFIVSDVENVTERVKLNEIQNNDNVYWKI